MGWTAEAPGVKRWEQEQTTFWEQNNFSLTSVQSIGRTSGKGFAVKVVLTVKYTASYKPKIAAFLSCRVGDAAAVTDTSMSVLSSTPTLTMYFVGEAAPGTEIATAAGWTESSSSRIALTFTAPELPGAAVYARVSGAWKSAAVYAKSGGAWKEAVAKTKIGGIWK